MRLVPAPNSLFGKLPRHGDFVRLGLRTDSDTALATWFLQAAEVAGGRLPTGNVCFAMRPAQAPQWLLGSWVLSRDSVGREFPLAVWTSLAEELFAAPMACFPLAAEQYLATLSAVLLDAAEREVAAVERVLAAVPTLHESALPAAWDALAQAQGESVGAFASRVFGAQYASQMYYALHTIVLACSRSQGESAQALTLDCPVRTVADIALWLDIIQACFGTERRPAPIWTRDGGRLLVVLGEPSSRLLIHLARPEAGGQALWPLTTSRPDAIDTARQALEPATRMALDTGAPLREVVASLSLTAGSS